MIAALTFSVSLPSKATTQPASNPTQDSAAPSAAEKELFTKGQNLYLLGNYTQAAEVLEGFLITYPNSIIADLVLLWLGRSYYQLGKFSEAVDVGKRLRAIKDTPFADIYDSELASARREAASRQTSAGMGDNPVSPALKRQGDSRPESPASRNRYAAEAGPTRTLTIRNVPSSATRPASRKPLANSRANAGLKSNRPVTRQRVNAIPLNSKRATAANNTTARAARLSSTPRNRSASNREMVYSGKANQSSRQRVPATQHRIAQSKQVAAAKSKLSSQSPRPSSSRASRNGASAQLSLPRAAASVRNPAPRRSRANANRPDVRSISLQRSRSTASYRPKISEPARLNQSPVRKRLIANRSDDSAPAAVLNRPTATGGLYSMIDASATNGLVGTTRQPPVTVISKRVNARPGEIVYLSFIVRNSGSARQRYEFRLSAPDAPEAKIYVDSNGDGIHQDDELPVTGSPVVELANSELSLLLEITVPRNAFEGQQYSYTLTVLSSDKEEVVATATSTLTVSSIRARLRLPNIAGDNAALAALARSP
ncbi:MAG: tetratricopeptide repeat protein [Pyrinomonadaceae bacterium]